MTPEIKECGLKRKSSKDERTYATCFLTCISFLCSICRLRRMLSLHYSLQVGHIQCLNLNVMNQESATGPKVTRTT